MSEYKIEKKIPVPMTAKRNNYPFADMGVGDSFQLALHENMQVRSAASWYGRRHNKKFSIRKFKDGYRCWRVE